MGHEMPVRTCVICAKKVTEADEALTAKASAPIYAYARSLVPSPTFDFQFCTASPAFSDSQGKQGYTKCTIVAA
jgi:hypothetical protein